MQVFNPITNEFEPISAPDFSAQAVEKLQEIVRQIDAEEDIHKLEIINHLLNEIKET